MKVIITGRSGLIGSALDARLRSQGHEVVGVSRQPGPGELGWDLDTRSIDAAGFEGADAVVHLAGETIDGRWTSAKKRRIRQSRVVGTTLVAETIAGLDVPPAVLVSASAINYYGDRGHDVITEQTPPGSSFLAGVCVEWEGAARPAAEAGVRVVHPRTGIVLTPAGGALARMLPVFRLFAGGRLGSGEQMWSWITLADEVAALEYLIEHDLEGPVNLTAPAPVSNRQFAAVLGQVLGRPAVLPAPAFALRTVLGEMAEELVLTSIDIRPQVLTRSGFTFAHAELGPALRAVLGDPSSRRRSEGSDQDG